MLIKTLSPKRGIIAFYDGDKYIIYSKDYGVVAESTSTKRSDDYNSVSIIFNVCEWHGYWDLKDTIVRGVRKIENEHVVKNVVIGFRIVEGWQKHLNKRLVVSTEDVC